MKKLLCWVAVFLLFAGCTHKPEPIDEPPEKPTAPVVKPETPPVVVEAQQETETAAEHALTLPKGSITCDISKIAGENRETVYASTILSDGKLAVVTKPLGEDGQSANELLIINPETQTLEFEIPIQSDLFPSLWESHGKLYVRTLSGDGAVAVFWVENGALTKLPFEFPQYADSIAFSPDGSCAAYYGLDYGLHLVDKTGDRVLIAGAQGEEGFGCKPREWIDNSRLLYNKVGYEWFIGNGIYNIATEKDTLLTSGAEDSYVIGIEDNKAFTYRYGDVVAMTSFGYYDLKDENYPWNALYQNPSEAWEQLGCYAVSPDGQLFAAVTDMVPSDTFGLRVISMTDGAVLLKVSEFHASSVRFIGDKLYIYHDRTATRPALLCRIPVNFES